MKPKIDNKNLYTFLWSCVDYVNYFNVISDERFEKRIYQLRKFKKEMESEV